MFLPFGWRNFDEIGSVGILGVGGEGEKIVGQFVEICS